MGKTDKAVRYIQIINMCYIQLSDKLLQKIHIQNLLDNPKELKKSANKSFLDLIKLFYI